MRTISFDNSRIFNHDGPRVTIIRDGVRHSYQPQYWQYAALRRFVGGPARHFKFWLVCPAV